MKKQLQEQIKSLDITIENLVNNNASDKVIGSLELKRQKLVERCKRLGCKSGTKKEEATDYQNQLNKIDNALVNKEGNTDELIQQRLNIVSKKNKDTKKATAKELAIIEDHKKQIAKFTKEMRQIGLNVIGLHSVSCKVCNTRFYTNNPELNKNCSTRCEFIECGSILNENQAVCSCCEEVYEVTNQEDLHTDQETYCSPECETRRAYELK